jgi:hypothetical protein
MLATYSFWHTPYIVEFHAGHRKQYGSTPVRGPSGIHQIVETRKHVEDSVLPTFLKFLMIKNHFSKYNIS